MTRTFQLLGMAATSMAFFVASAVLRQPALSAVGCVLFVLAVALKQLR